MPAPNPVPVVLQYQKALDEFRRHPAGSEALLKRMSELIWLLTAGGPVLGLLESVRYEVGEIGLAPGDVLAMVTDGATEALSADEREWGDERLVQALVGPGARSAEQQIERLIQAVDAWTGERGCTDDLTALVLTAV